MGGRSNATGTSGQGQADETSFNLLKQAVGENLFGGQHYPKVFITDDSLAEQNAIKSNSIESALNRCSVQPLRRARIPDGVFVQLFLLRMGMSSPETCRG